MNRYQKLFKNLKYNKLGAFVPFITLGDPNLVTCMRIIDTLITAGSDALEIGIPFSDPLSDGPILQNSIQRAFNAGINFPSCLTMLNDIRKKYPNIPIGLLIYANLIFKYGINNFYSHCSTIDIDSVLIPDVPIEESLPFLNSAIYYKIAQIFICPPNASEKLIYEITMKGNGYIYLLSRPGVTGYNTKKTNTVILHQIIKCIQRQKKVLPILQGFGIHTAQQAQTSISLGTSGIISGSAIAEIIANNIDNIDILLQKLTTLVQIMKTSMYLNNIKI